MGHPILFEAEDPWLARVRARFSLPAYIRGKGRLGVDGPDTDREEIAELLDASWRRSAPARSLR